MEEREYYMAYVWYREREAQGDVVTNVYKRFTRPRNISIEGQEELVDC